MRYLGYKYCKNTTYFNKNESLERIKQYAYFAIEYSKIVSNNEDIIYIDEVSLGGKEKEIKQWINERNKITFQVRKRERRSTAIVAMSDRGVLYYEIHFKTINGKIFWNYMNSLVEYLLKDSHYLESYNSRSLNFYVDNAPPHRHEDELKNFKFGQAKLIWCIPYTPIYNPIELLFGGLKNKIRSNLTDNLDTRLNTMINFFKGVTLKYLRNLIKHTYKEMILDFNSILNSLSL